jgi:hypothetical protein
VLKRLTSTLLLVTLAHAAAAGCGGESLRHGDSDDGGETGGTSANGGGGAAGTGAGGSSPGTGGTGLGGNGATAGTGTGTDHCILEPDPGSCLAAMGRWAFDATTGLCLPFTYGGCGGNGNNFETIESCYASCGIGARSAAACSTPTDCTLIRSSCCGCESPTLGNRVAVNVNRTGDVFQALRCHLVDCVACEPIAPNPWLGATCTNGQCVAFDARQSELTACMSNDDCYLRAGLGCCEACSASLDAFVAVSSLVNLRPLLCGNTGPVACDACVPTPPDLLFAYCGDGRCGVAIAER